jgi:hypothetical protein
MKASERKKLNGVWWAMHQRCSNADDPAYRNYGARGIRVCERWQSLDFFIADMGARPRGFTLERRDNDGPYAPDNCRWASRAEQARNRRGNVVIELGGKAMIAEDWARHLNIPSRALCKRIRSGILPAQAVAMGRGRCRTEYSPHRGAVA